MRTALEAPSLPEVRGPCRDPLLPASAHPLVDGAPSVVVAGGVALGGPKPVLIAGAPREADVALRLLDALGAAGGHFLRIGDPQPGRGPALALPQLRRLRAAAEACGLGLVATVQSLDEARAAAGHAELLHVPPHLMQAFSLLRAVGSLGRPVLLSRGPAATLGDWLLAAEYVLLAGAPGIVFCEGGIRTFAHPERTTLDLGDVVELGLLRGLPVLVAPAAAAGRPEAVAPLCRAALAAGASGLLLELEREPYELPFALSRPWSPS
jgi:3-deoxy-7-phosphoheptulonate synthase